MTDLDERLLALPPAPLPPALATRALFRARAELARGGAGERRPRWASLATSVAVAAGERRPRWASLATSVAVAASVAVYLTWVVDFLRALARG